MKEKFKEAVDNGNEFGALLTDLSKAFYRTFDKFFHILRVELNVPK